MAVPYTFGSATTSIPLSQLDSNFATTITLGNTAIQLGNTVTTLNNMTLGNVTVSSGNVVAGIASSTITQSMLATGVAGTGPAFGAYAGSATSLSGGAFTKVLFDTEEFDTNSNFASSRFTPTIAGYYQINGYVSVSTGTQLATSIYKNGSDFKRGTNNRATSEGSNVASLIYFNGSTDYVEIYCFATSTINNNASQPLTYFNGCLVRSA
jgi:hypothetical protein